MGIIIKNMKKLPKTCFKCKFCNYEYNGIFNTGCYICTIEHSYILCNEKTQKPQWCPLKEVK